MNIKSILLTRPPPLKEQRKFPCIKCVRSPFTNEPQVIYYFFDPTTVVDLYIEDPISGTATGLNKLRRNFDFSIYKVNLEPLEGKTTIDLFFGNQSKNVFPYCVCTRNDDTSVNEVFRVFSPTEVICIYSPNSKRVMQLISPEVYVIPNEVFNGAIKIEVSMPPSNMNRKD